MSKVIDTEVEFVGDGCGTTVQCKWLESEVDLFQMRKDVW